MVPTSQDQRLGIWDIVKVLEKEPVGQLGRTYFNLIQNQEESSHSHIDPSPRTIILETDF